MRILLAAVALALCVSVENPSTAQTCETLSVRNAAGLIISSKQICVDHNGAWVDPATVNAIAEPAPVVVQPLPTLETVTTRQPAPLPQPVLSTEQPAELFLPTPPPTPIATVPPIQPVSATEEIELQPAQPIASAPPSGWEPTTGATKRQQLYAKLGLVCEARSAQFCSNGNCSGLCLGKQGWCDAKTGEVYASIDAIERVYCRKKKLR